MADMTNYSESALLNHLLGLAAFTMPETVYVGLFTAAPSDAGGGTEVSGFGYERQPITSVMSESTGGSQSTNGSIIRFGPAAGADWGDITHCALFDAAEGGNMLMWSALDDSVFVGDGNAFEFDVASLVAELD